MCNDKRKKNNNNVFGDQLISTRITDVTRNINWRYTQNSISENMCSSCRPIIEAKRESLPAEREVQSVRKLRPFFILNRYIYRDVILDYTFYRFVLHGKLVTLVLSTRKIVQRKITVLSSVNRRTHSVAGPEKNITYLLLYLQTELLNIYYYILIGPHYSKTKRNIIITTNRETLAF